MDRFRELATFCAVAEEGAFNAAARRMHMSAPVVTRLVRTLEQHIGAQLLTRTTRSVRLTEVGERFYVEAHRILADLEQAETMAAGAHQVPRGTLSVTAPVLFGQRFVMPVVREFLDAHPDVSVTTLFVDRVVHLIEEGFDVALRIGELGESSLYALRVASVRLVAVAAPDYLKQYGAPSAPEELLHHRIINTSNLNRPSEWMFEVNSRSRSIRIAPRLTVNTNTAAIDAAIAGWGIARVLSYQVADALDQGQLVEVLPGSDNRELPVQLVHPDGPRAAAKTRAFLDLAAQRLRANARRLSADRGV